MPRTTPPRPLDVAARFPELAPLARTAVRLHPRPGSPTAADSSIGGPLLWPAGEPWPTCPEHAGPRQWGHPPENVRQERRLLAEAWRRPRAEGADLLSDEERARLDRLGKRVRVPLSGPLPMIPVAQLYAADVPGLPGPPGTDLLQLLWCPFRHRNDHLPRTVLRRRTAAGITDVLPADAVPRPPVVGRAGYLPEPCVLHPEPVTEYPAPHELPGKLAGRVERWARRHGWDYQADLAVAPGCKVGGHAPWSFSDPAPMACPACGAEVRPLLTVVGGEWDAGSRSWRPAEDADHPGPHFLGPARSTHLDISDSSLQLYGCTRSYDHPHVRGLQ
ncbi:hypothetical protein [Streptomyces sp. CC219B]|uniref:hypothetical protein n=1 Tax=Streptomyces sp. CC219B TaxID=3044574 RepID=UPI0024A9E33E|nr:hypothetical protein [Streptomyces sp. CC219B]